MAFDHPFGIFKLFTHIFNKVIEKCLFCYSLLFPDTLHFYGVRADRLILNLSLQVVLDVDHVRSVIYTTYNLVSEWAIFVLMPNEHLFSYIIMRTSKNWLDGDDDIRFVLDQHTKLDFYSAISLTQQSLGRHVTPLRHIILIPTTLSFYSLVDNYLYHIYLLFKFTVVNYY